MLNLAFRLTSYCLAFSLTLTTTFQTAYAAENRVGGSFEFTNPKASAASASAPVTGGEKVNLGDLLLGSEISDSSGEEVANFTSSDVNNEPGINLGKIPGRASGGSSGTASAIPSTSPYAPWNPADSYGGRPGMLAIPATMMPGTICPLVDNRPNPEILDAINNLFNYMMPAGNCRSEHDQTKLNEIANKMRESGTALKTLYTGVRSGETDSSAIDLAAVQSNIQVLVGGMDTLGAIVQSSPLSRGSNCGQAELKGGELLKAMGELITSVAPYALLLASVGTGGTAGVAATVAKPLMVSMAKPALTLLLGTFAVGSVATMYNELINKGSMDMTKPDQQEALLQNLCEYFRIEQRVNYLKQADMGNVDNISARINFANQKMVNFKSNLKAALEQNFPKEVLQLAQIEESLSAQLRNAQKNVRAARSEMNDIKKARGDGSNIGTTCTLGRMLAKKATDTNIFPGKAIKNYQFILSKQTRTTTAQDLYLQTEADLRDSLNSLPANTANSAPTQCAPGTQCKANQLCADIAKDYVDNLSNLIEDSNYRIGILQTSMNNQLNESPSFKSFKNVQSNLKREILVRESTGRVVANLKGNEASIVRQSIDYSMDIFKKTLFSSSWVGQSPVYAWLSFSSKKFRDSLRAYLNELNELQDFTAKVAPSSGFLSSFGKYAETVLFLKNLAVINTTSVRPGTYPHRDVCHILNNLTLEWHSVSNSLNAQKFFCDSIAPMMDSRVEKSIKEFCFGQYNPITREIYARSEIEKNALSIDKEYGSRNRAIQAKYKELKCQTQDSAQVMR